MAVESLPKHRRLLTASEYETVLRHPDVTLGDSPLRLRARKNRMQAPRLGLAVPRRGTPRATRRNRIKRLIREAFRKRAHTLPDTDVVVQVLGPVDDATLVDELAALFDDLERVAATGRRPTDK